MSGMRMQRQPEPEVMDLADEAEAYARADFGEVNQAFVDRLVELAVGRTGLTALDVGTGPGDIPLRLAGLCPSWQVVAVDAAWPMLAWAKRALASAGRAARVRLVLADAKRLPLADGAFDIVFSNSILHHLNDTDAFWGGVRRVVRPGGLVFVRDLVRPADPDTARGIVAQYAGQESALLQEEFYRSLLAAYTIDEVRDQLGRCGLGALGVRQVTDRHLDIVGWGR